MVTVDIGGGDIVASMATGEAVRELGSPTGNAAYVLVKASEAMIAVH